jgi:hypothetical protein
MAMSREVDMLASSGEKAEQLHALIARFLDLRDFRHWSVAPYP